MPIYHVMYLEVGVDPASCVAAAGLGMAPPLSVDELLAQQAQQPVARPRFVSRKEREKHREAEQAAASEADAAKQAQVKRARIDWLHRGDTKPAPAPAADVRTRPVRRARDTMKRFHFEWSADDDTSEAGVAGDVSAPVLRRRAGMDGSERSASGRSTMPSILAEKPWSDKTLEEMRPRDWRIFREDYQIQIKGGTDAPPPLRAWRESRCIPPALLDAIDALGYREPTPIQRQAIPVGLQCRDLIGLAETGSGKTLSFVVPMLAHVLRTTRTHGGPYGLILAPTRELAQQIEVEAHKLARQLGGVRVVSIVGGRDLGEQAHWLGEGADMVIATPGRLQDCLERHMLVLTECRFLVLDEADRMIDMNYEDALHAILDCLPAQRTTMLYSATMPPTVDRMARTYLQQPLTIVIGQAGQAVGTVEQRVEMIHSEAERLQGTLQALDSGLAPPMMVFVNQKANADVVGRELRRAGWHVAILHSGLSQPQREAAIASVREGVNEILCCTDIGARGLDLPNVSLVVNYQFPTQFASYIHRIGRTGRAGRRGCAVSMVGDDDAEHFYALRLELAKSPVSTVPAFLAQHPAAMAST